MTALFIILAVIAAIVLLVVVRRRNGSVDAPEPQDTASISTPGGVTVFSNVWIRDEALLAIDEGITKTIERMPGEWMGGRYLPQYTVHFVAPDGFGPQGNPFLVHGGIETWGYVEGISNDPSGNSDHMIIVMPDQQANGWTRPDWVSGTAWSESEHIAERLASIQLNDPEIFWKWARLGADDTHPHRP